MKTNFKKICIGLPVVLLLAMVMVKCKKDAAPPAPVLVEPKPTAKFEVKLPDSAKFLEYEFTQSSINYKEFLWQFGDDSTSVAKDPKHAYRFPGTYHVTLTTRNGQGYTASQELYLKVVDPNFDPSKIGENYIQAIGGTLSVTRDNGSGPDGGEGSKKMIDGDLGSKFVQDGFDGTLKCTFELNTPKVVGAYTLTSGNDGNDRDPRFWIFQGSVDGIQYRDLHTITSCPWANGNNVERRVTRRFYFDNFVAYKFYRIYFKANRGSRLFQMAEWTINKKQP